MASAGPNQKSWINVPANSKIMISGDADDNNFTITVEEDDGANPKIVCKDAGVIPGPCTRTLSGGTNYIYTIVITIGGNPGPNVTVRARIVDPAGNPVGSEFATTASGSANSPYSITLTVLTV
jgi:hypothetical protein